MKKIWQKSLASMVSAALCLTAFVGCLTVNAETAGSATVTVGEVTAKTTDTTVEVPVTIAVGEDATTGIAAAIFDITVDSAKFDFSKRHWDSCLTYDTAQNIHVSTITNGDFIQPLNGTNNTYRFLVEGLAEGSTDENTLGTFTSATFNLTFDVIDNTAGETAITFNTDTMVPQACNAGTLDLQGNYTGAEEPFSVATVAGKITVQAAQPACEHANATKVLKEKTDTAFVYTCSCPDCDVADWEEEIAIGADYDGDIGNAVRNISPTNGISMTFRFPSANLSAYSDFVAYFTKQEYASNQNTYTLKPYLLTNGDTTSYAGYIAYRFTDIAAYEMSSEISATLYGYDAKSNTMVKLKTETFTVVQYVKGILANSNASYAKLKVSLVDLLNYGAAAQTVRNCNMENLPNSTLTEAEKALGTPESEYCDENTVWATLPESAGELSGADDTNRIALSRTLVTGDKVKMQYTLTSFAGDINNYYCVFNYYDVKGAVQTKTYSYADIGFSRTNPSTGVTTYGFLFEDALIPTLDYPVSATFYYGDPDNGGVPVYQTYFSIEYYVSNFYNFSNAKLATLVKTIYAYGNSLANAVNTPAYAG